MGRRRRSIATLIAVFIAVGLVAIWPAVATAHPLGNFSINHYAGIRVEPDRILLDIVIDRAEIPTFEARQDFDLDGDGSISDEEIETGRITGCDALSRSVALTVGQGNAPTLGLSQAGLSFTLGAGGLPTMRQVCVFEARLAEPIGSIGSERVQVGFTERAFAGRLGWREVVTRGSGVQLRELVGVLRTTDVSGRLLRYPQDSIASPLADGPLVVEASIGGPPLPAFGVPDARPVPGAASAPAPSVAPASAPPAAPSPRPAPASPASSPATEPAPIASAAPAAVPGGIGGELPEIFRRPDLTPIVLLLSLATAAGLGAGHALTPGHGKTLMAAYLVGTRGTARHALGLGAAVSVSHTAGILVLAAIVVAATDVLAPDMVIRWAPVVAAISIVLIGGWMLLGELRRRRQAAPRAHAPPTDHSHPHDHQHPHAHAHPHDHHGGHDHRHGPAPGATITWRGLFVLGLAGGLIPSTSALLILLGSIAAGRPAFGLVLVVAFGLGMAAVMAGIGLALVMARDRVDRMGAGGGMTRLREYVPLAAAVVVLGFGALLTVQALTAISTPAF